MDLNCLGNPTKMLEIKEICTDEEFSHLKGEWDLLLSKSGSNNIFLTWDWLYNWWKIFHQGRRLNILIVRENGELKAIAPLFLSVRNPSGVRQLQFLGSEAVGSDYLDFILYPNKEEKLLDLMLNFLNKNRRTWDLINLQGVPETSKTSAIFKKQQRLSLLSKLDTICPYIELPDKKHKLYRTLSSNMRNQIRRKKRKFEQDCNGKFIVLREKGKLNVAIDNFIRLNENRFKAKRMSSPFSDDLFNRFHRKIIPIFFQRGLLELDFLHLGDTPIAAIYLFKYDHRYLYYQSGFDSAWHKISPGMLIFEYAISKAIEEGIKEFDFLQGNEDYKYRWTSNDKKNLQLVLFNSSPRSRTVNFFFSLRFRLSAARRSRHPLF